MFEQLSDRIDKAIRQLKGQHRITDINIAGTLKEIRRALIEADVHYKLAKEVCDGIKTRALGEKITLSVSPGAHLTRMTADALAEMMGEAMTRELSFKQSPSVILVTGLQGSGKTTFSAKLALHLKKGGRRPLLAACDVYRPAAIEQLETLAKEIEVPFYKETNHKKPLGVAQNALKAAKREQASVVIVDTAGRTTLDASMMAELKEMGEKLRPDENLLVLDAMNGQEAANTALSFGKVFPFSAIVLSKMDSDTRGGAALSVCALTKRPILFVSTGEKVEDLDRFHPNRMAKRILGMGDVISFVEKTEAAYEKKEAQKLAEKIRKKQFDLNDYLTQLKKIKKMGNLKEMMASLPGLGSHVKKWTPDPKLIFELPEVIIQSMTPYERKHPDVIKKDRRMRIAKGSGRSIQEVNELLKRYETLRTMLRKGQAGKGLIKQKLVAR